MIPHRHLPYKKPEFAMNAGFCFIGQARGACPYVYCRGVKFYAPTPLTPLRSYYG